MIVRRNLFFSRVGDKTGEISVEFNDQTHRIVAFLVDGDIRDIAIKAGDQTIFVAATKTPGLERVPVDIAMELREGYDPNTTVWALPQSLLTGGRVT